MKVKTGQTVKVVSGKDKGKTGQVIQVFPDLDKVVVEGVNKAYKHLKNRRSRTDKGERVEFFAPIHVSNVKLVEAAAEKSKRAESKSEEKPKRKSTKKKEA